jgi:hypothetical protein
VSDEGTSFVTIVRRALNNSAHLGRSAICARYRRRVPRKPRTFHPGVPIHITLRGVDDQPIFLSDLDRHELLVLLRKITERVGWQVARGA